MKRKPTARRQDKLQPQQQHIDIKPLSFTIPALGVSEVLAEEAIAIQQGSVPVVLPVLELGPKVLNAEPDYVLDGHVASRGMQVVERNRLAVEFERQIALDMVPSIVLRLNPVLLGFTLVLFLACPRRIETLEFPTHERRAVTAIQVIPVGHRPQFVLPIFVDDRVTVLGQR